MSYRHSLLLLTLFLAGIPLWASAQQQATTAAEDAAVTYLERNWNRHGLASQTDVTDLVIADAVTSRRSGRTSVYLHQGIDGVPVIDGQMTVSVDESGHVLHAAGRLIPNLDRTASVATIGADAAANAIAREAGFPAPEPFAVVTQEASPTRKTTLTDGGGHTYVPVTAELVYAIEDGAPHLAWEATVALHGEDGAWRGLVDAGSGAVLRLDDVLIYDDFGTLAENAARTVEERPLIVKQERSTPGRPLSLVEGRSLNTSAWLSAGSVEGMLPHPTATKGGMEGECYRVFAWPQMDPFHADPAWPDDGRTWECDPFDPVTSPGGWHDDDGDGTPDYTITRGNNVSAYADWTNNPDPPAPDGGSDLHFDFPIDFGDSPEESVDASATNLFYWNNLMHDVMVHYGFDEAHGNFQQHNYTGDGIDGDHVNAEAQDNNLISCNNANFLTLPDGQPGRMQMYLGCNHSPRMDGSLDNHVVLHEYGHGVSIRMTGGPSNVFCLNNAEQMGEGWSDFYGLMLSQDETAFDYGRNEPIGAGVYLFHDGAPNGIRPAPYTTDFGINDYTYQRTRTLAVPHGVGFVWATILWEVTWDLIDEYGFEQDITSAEALVGNTIMMNLVTEGLNLQPCSPGFVDGRDAILAAVDVVYADQAETWRTDLKRLMWEGFARRGLGLLADQGETTSNADNTEDFTAPSEIAPEAITDLGGEGDVTSVTLTWTAPGDDDSDVYNYHVRYASAPIVTTGDWEGATPVPAAEEMTPQAPGTTEELVVTGLDPETTYHLAVRSDDGFSVSDLSNTVEVVTLAAPVAAFSPGSFEFAVGNGGSDSGELTIQNSGATDLTWNILTAESDFGSSEVWSDGFDGYAAGSQIHGQGGWKGWFNTPSAGALVSDAEARSAPHSVDIEGDTDLAHEFDDFSIEAGQWVITAWQFIPEDFEGSTYYIQLNNYNDQNSDLNWSTQVEFQSVSGFVVNQGVSGGTLPLITGEWVELRVEIDLDNDTQEFYYNGELLYAGTWMDEASGGGALTFDTINLYANGSTSVYYDDISVGPKVGCEVPTEVAWLSVSQESGTTAPGSSSMVDVMVDASTVGTDAEYSAVLCAMTNDPVALMVEIPVTMTVGTVGGEDDDLAFEGTHRLSAVAPNPISGLARTTLEVADAQDVRIELFDMRGRKVATPFEGALAARTAQEISLDGNGLAPGVYVLRITGETFAETRRVAVVR